MRILSNCFLASMLVFALSGCVSESALRQLVEAQRDADAFSWQQAERLQQQNAQVANLEREIHQLEQKLSDILNELSDMRSKQVQPVATAPLTKRKASKAQSDTSNVVKTRFGKVVLGQLEWVWFDLFNRSVQTHIDTGVKSSTIYVSQIQFFERDGDEWVRFSYAAEEPEDKLTSSESQVYETPVVKRVRVKNAQREATDKRVFISLRIKLGDLVDDPQLLLVEKGSSPYGIVLGRSFLRDIAVVDVAKKFTQPKFRE